MAGTTGNTGRGTLTRRAAACALPLVLAMGLSACGGASGSSSDGKIHLAFTWWGSDARHTATKKLIAKFQETHPGIVIDPQYTSFDNYWDRLATSVAGGNTPDVMQQESRYVREYADRGALADLKQFMPSIINDAQFDKTVASTGSVEDKTYAIPTGINAYSIVVDPGQFKKAGVALPDDKTWTWDDFVNTMAKVTKASGGKVYGTQDLAYTEGGLQIFARQRGEAVFTPDGKIGVSAQTVKDWWTLVLKMRDTKAEPPASVSHEVQTAGIDQSLLATGKGAAGGWWTNELPALVADAKHELKIMRFPGEAQRKGMYLKPAMFWSISARSKHPKEAAQFVNFLVNDPEAAKIQLSDRGLPINTSLRAQIEGRLAAADKQSAQFVQEVGPTLQAPPALPPKGAGELQNVLKQINEEVLFNRMAPDKAATQFLDQMKSAISG